MKKNIFMILAMFTVAFTAISFTSCTKDDDNLTKKEDTVYSGTATLTLYDPQNELNDKQKKELKEVVDKTPVFNVMYSTDENLVEQRYENWRKEFLTRLLDYMDNNPEVADTKYAGVKVLKKGNSWGSQVDETSYIFCEIAKTILGGK